MTRRLRVSANWEREERSECPICNAVLVEDEVVVTGERVTCEECGAVLEYQWDGMNMRVKTGKQR